MKKNPKYWHDGTPPHDPRRHPAVACRRWFTLVELLAVISVILILLVLLLPMLNSVMSQVRGVFCANNMRSLTVAWSTYANEFNGKMPNATATYPGGGRWPATYPPWSGNVSSVPSTAAQRRAALEQGSLWPYVNNYSAYHCPDHPFNRTPQELVRNYSINNFTGGLEICCGFPDQTALSGGADGIADPCPSDRPATGHVASMSMVFVPAKTFVFIEEDDNRGDLVGGYFVDIGKDAWRWIDPPGRWHSVSKYDKGGTMFSFADGHTEYWKWRDARTRTQISPDPGVNWYATQAGSVDLLRLKLAVCPGNPYVPVLNNNTPNQ